MPALPALGWRITPGAGSSGGENQDQEGMAKEAVPHARGRGSDAEAAGLDNAGSSRGYEDVARCLTAIALACPNAR